MKRFLLIIVSIAMIVSLTACGGSTNQGNSGSSDTENKVVINFFHRWPNEPRNTYFNEIISEFEELNPHVKINVDRVLNDPYKEKIRVLIASEDLPHIFTSWSDSFAENIVSSGKVKDVNYLFEDDKEWASNIMKSQLRAFTFDNKVYGVPFTIDGKAFFYNKDIFLEHGIEVPKTFEDFIGSLEKLKNEGYETPLIEGLSDAWAISHYMGTIFQRVLDPEILDKDYNPQTGEFTHPDYITALNAFKTLTDYMGDVATAIDHETARNMFANGEVPVMYMQFAEIKMVEDIGNVSLGFFDFPPFEEGKGNPTALTGAPEGFMLGKNAPKEAEEFLKFIVSKENAYKFTKVTGQLTAVEGAVTPSSASNHSLEAYDIILKASQTVPWFDNAVNISIADAFMRGGQSMAIGEMTAEDVLKRVQEEAATLRK
ncbi:ABC transporter substrate-binding protein [Alkaliphilus peptidifermentans]|uniref:Raffinose/stachyose/melibiose transport system substrate-binding protein n=1 Tax=Alkaliphilus peptidifermentans DSM 18978 TaxID=1120976 RepID=A0A1G5HQZ9_9FIRM|nr:ABC transporter substrate-binding protein [Alkaliphilus peptidifermentans]SCY66295.1 raffinose/stachyose/melibiose transport system substrate-binding protein [Alkaliphilus peptidifermentans DSM 18978]